MRKNVISIVFILMCAAGYAQSPNQFNYQAVVHKDNGEIVADQSIGVRISILEGSITGESIYSETHTSTSNKYGIINLFIGSGSSSDDFNSINWPSGTFFIKTELDIEGGTEYTTLGTSQILSVPYALYANNCASLDFPEGICGEVVNVAKGEDYTVPSGKTLYIPQGEGTSLNGQDCSYHRPAAIKEGNVVTNYSGLITGFLVTKNLEIINLNTTDGNYIVPTGKTLYILSKGSSNALTIDGNNYFLNFSSTLILKEGTTISGVITGYLK